VVDNSRNLLRAVEQAQLDVAFVVERAAISELLEVIERTIEPLVVVSSRAFAATVSQAALSGRLPRFISYDQASTTHQLVSEALQKRGLVAEPVFYSTSPDVMLRLVLLGKGVAALPYLLVRELHAAGELVIIGGAEPLLIQRPVVAVKRRDVLLAAPLARTVHQVVGLFAALPVDRGLSDRRRGLRPSVRAQTDTPVSRSP
jgi:DNA-binding transcriptional LysR family regulator